MMKRKAQIWDNMEVFGKAYNNNHMYCFMDVPSKLNVDLLQLAMDRSLTVFPILKSRYVVGKYKAFWIEDNKKEPVSSIEVVELEDGSKEEEEIDSFIRDEIDETSNLQIKIKILRDKGIDRVCIAMNHMVCDAADFKQYLYTLSKIYTELLCDMNYIPDDIRDGNRSGVGVYFDFIKSLKNYKSKLSTLFQGQNHKDYNQRMTFSHGHSLSPFIATLSIDKERFKVLKQYSKDNEVTINDIFLAAFIRTLHSYIPNKTEAINIPCMVDLRRFQTNHSFDTLKNLTSTLVVNIGEDIGINFDTTVNKVHKEVSKLLQDFTALNGYLYLILLFQLLPIKQVKKIIDRHFKSFPIAFSNLGIIDKSKLQFGDKEVLDCYMTGSIKQVPCFWLALSSFDGKITVTINLNGSREDKEYIEGFLEALDNELPEERSDK